jgi:hypothetical protein
MPDKLQSTRKVQAPTSKSAQLTKIFFQIWSVINFFILSQQFKIYVRHTNGRER